MSHAYHSPLVVSGVTVLQETWPRVGCTKGDMMNTSNHGWIIKVIHLNFLLQPSSNFLSRLPHASITAQQLPTSTSTTGRSLDTLDLDTSASHACSDVARGHHVTDLDHPSSIHHSWSNNVPSSPVIFIRANLQSIEIFQSISEYLVLVSLQSIFYRLIRLVVIQIYLFSLVVTV